MEGGHQAGVENGSLPPPPPSLTLPPLPPAPSSTTPSRRTKSKPTSPAAGGPSADTALSDTPSPLSHSTASSSSLLSPPTPKHANPSSPPQSKKKRRSPYKCHKCGKPKKGHICTAVDPSSLALFKERDARPPQPAYPSSPPTTSLSLASLAATSSALSPSIMSSSSSSITTSPYPLANSGVVTPSGEWLRIAEDDETDDDSDLQNRQSSSVRPLPLSYNGNEEEMGRVPRRGKAKGSASKKRGRRGEEAELGEDELEDPEADMEAGGYNNTTGGGEGEESIMGAGLSRHTPFLGDIAALYNSSSDTLFPTDALSRYELAGPEAAAAYGSGSGSGSSWANWGAVGDTGAGDDDLDISLFGYIDERPPEKVSGVGISIDQKKVPYFVSWFDMAVSGLDMLQTFLKTQRPVWRALPTVLENLQEQKRRLNAWKENFGKEVIAKAVEEADSTPSQRDDAEAVIGEADRAGTKRKTPEGEGHEAAEEQLLASTKRKKSEELAAAHPRPAA